MQESDVRKTEEREEETEARLRSCHNRRESRGRMMPDKVSPFVSEIPCIGEHHASSDALEIGVAPAIRRKRWMD